MANRTVKKTYGYTGREWKRNFSIDVEFPEEVPSVGSRVRFVLTTTEYVINESRGEMQIVETTILARRHYWIEHNDHFVLAVAGDVFTELWYCPGERPGNRWRAMGRNERNETYITRGIAEADTSALQVLK